MQPNVCRLLNVLIILLQAKYPRGALVVWVYIACIEILEAVKKSSPLNNMVGILNFHHIALIISWKFSLKIAIIFSLTRPYSVFQGRGNSAFNYKRGVQIFKNLGIIVMWNHENGRGWIDVIGNTVKTGNTLNRDNTLLLPSTGCTRSTSSCQGTALQPSQRETVWVGITCWTCWRLNPAGA